MAKSKSKRKGQLLEDLLDFTHQLYKNKCKADIVKRQIRTVLDKRTGQMCYVKAEGFDYEGTAAPYGKSVCVEAKEAKERLYVDKNNKQGLRLRQLEAILFRASLGACTAVIWMQSPNQVFLLDWSFLLWFHCEVYKKGVRKSITVDMALKNNQAQVMKNGMIDYLQVLINANINSRVFSM